MAAGMALDRWYDPPWQAALAVCGGGLLAWLLFRWADRPTAAATALLLSIAACGSMWHYARWNCYDERELGRYARIDRAPACLIVVARGEPVRSPAPPDDPMRVIPIGERSRLEVSVEQIRHGRGWLPATGRATLLCEGHLLGVGAGDRLQVFAQLAQPEPPSGAGEFDFPTFLRSRRQLAQLYAAYPDCVLPLEQQPESLGGMFDRWRAAGDRLLWHYIDRRRAGLAAAVLLGERNQLDRERTEAFVETGTVHLLAISGLHVGILAGALLFLLNLCRLPRRWTLLIVCGLTLFYAGLADARPPVLRASILVVALCASIYVGRRTSSFNTLAAAALVVLMLNPADLFQVGAQLSFLAVATLMAVHAVAQARPVDPLKQLIRHTRPLPQRFLRKLVDWFTGLMLAGLAIWLVALPLILYHFQLVSPAGIVLTPLLIPLLSIALFAGMVVLGAGWLCPPLAEAAGRCAGLALGLLETSVQRVAELPLSYFYLPGPAAWWLAGYYLLLGGWVLVGPGRIRLTWCAAVLASWIAIGFAWTPLTNRQPALECTFVNVGHGCGVLLELPDGRTILYDAGRLGNPTGAVEAISGELWSRGKWRIDTVIVSHADADHYNGLPRLLERFSIGAVYVSPVMLESDSQGVRHLLESLVAADVPVRTIEQGDRLDAGEVTIEVLHPTGKGVIGPRPERSDNANSLVLAIEYHGRRILLPGDLESPGLDDVIAELPYDCDVLMAPHHGSRRSAPQGFSDWCQPEWTIVSGGRGLDLTETLAAYGGEGRAVLHTAESGNVTVRVTARGYEVNRYLE